METRLKILNRYRRGDGIRKISRDMNLSRNTIRDVIRNEGNKPIAYKREKQAYPILGDYIEPLEKLLKENNNKQAKRTIRQIFNELENLGYKGSESTVGRYIVKWNKQNKNSSASTACVPLSFKPGEAYQFDWSNEKILINNEYIQVKVAHFVLCYSRKKFVYIYPNETQEMVFDAHVREFSFFNGSPAKGIYDNMKTAVKKVLHSRQRQWNDNFMRLCAHYRIEPIACTPARGNEKGIVERQVKIDRTQFFTPTLEGPSLTELNNILVSKLVHYNATHKHPEYREKTLDDVFFQEQECFIKVPFDFDGCREIEVKVSTTCLARFDRNNYSVHCSCASKIVICKAYSDKVIFIHEGREVGRHKRQFTRGKTYYDWLHYLPILANKPGALRNGAPFVDMVLPDELNKVRNHLEKQINGTRDFAHILSYIPIESIESVTSACAKAIREGTISKDVIVNILLRNHDSLDIDNEDNIIYLPLEHNIEVDCNFYNSLLSGEQI